MSTSAAIQPKGSRKQKPGIDVGTWTADYLLSTVGSKVIVAITGASLVGFVVFHMIGNLKMFNGPDSINTYAYFLKHDLGLLIWIARAGLLGLFVAHIALTIRLKWLSAEARPVPYRYQAAAQATTASQYMLITGLVIGAFAVFHLAHYTFGWVHEVVRPDGTRTNYLNLMDEQGRHNVYEMVIAGFSSTWIAVTYVIAQLFLAVHLAHGIQSVIQTIGLKNARFAPVWTAIGYATAVALFLGNTAIVVAVWTGILKSQI